MSFTPFAEKKDRQFSKPALCNVTKGTANCLDASLRSCEFFLPSPPNVKSSVFFKAFFSGFLFQKNKRGLSSRHPHAAIWPFWIEFLLVKYIYKKYQNRNQNNKTSCVHTHKHV